MQGGGFDLALNEAGHRQAALLAQEFADVPLGFLVSSHLQRARQTADALQARQPSSTRRLPDLEGLGEMRFGEFEGLALRGPHCTKEITERFQYYNDGMKRDKDVAWPGGGESLAQVEARAVGAVRRILQLVDDKHKDDTAESTQPQSSSDFIGIVAHGRTLNILLASLLGEERDARLFAKYRQRNCGVNVLDVSPDLEHTKCLLLSYNDHITTADADAQEVQR